MNHRTVETLGTTACSPFPPTLWAVVQTAGAQASPQARAAMEQLCVMYREPILAWLQRRGHPQPHAEDLTHGFLELWLTRNHLQRYVRTRAKFRSFLLRCLERYCLRVRDSTDVTWVPLDEVLDDGVEPQHDVEFDRSIARTHHRLAMARLQAQYERSGYGQRFQVLRPRLFGDPEGASYAELGRTLGLSITAVKKAMFDLRERYYDTFRAVISEGVSTHQDLDEEMRYQVTLLADTEVVEQP